MKHEKTFEDIAKLKDIEVELHRLKNALEIANKALDAGGEVYERGFIDGMQKQMQSSVDKAVNAMSKREWVGLTQEDIDIAFDDTQEGGGFNEFARAIEQTLRRKNT